jgi:hypothetical protein
MRRKFFFPLLFIPVVFLAGLVVQSLWNAILPDLLHVGMIGYWQAMGLLVLARLLFGGFHGGHCGRGRCTPHHWDKLNPEEREKLRTHWRSRCGWNAEPPPADVQ